MQCVTAVDGEWLAELGPMFYSVKQAGKSPILKVFIEFVILLLLFYVLFSLWPQSLCDFSSLTRDGTHTSCIQK